MNEALVARTLELLRREGDMRAVEIAAALDDGGAPVKILDLLQSLVDDGRVFAVSIETAEGKFRGYRLAAAGGADRQPGAAQAKPVRQIVLAKRETVFGADPAPGAAINLVLKKEIATMSIADKCEAAFKKHGPMTTRQLGAYVNDVGRSAIMSQCAKAGRVVILGGKKFNFIYGLPGQKLPAAGEGVDIDAAHAGRGKKRAKKGKPPSKRTGGGQAHAAQGA